MHSLSRLSRIRKPKVLQSLGFRAKSLHNTRLQVRGSWLVLLCCSLSSCVPVAHVLICKVRDHGSSRALLVLRSELSEVLPKLRVSAERVCKSLPGCPKINRITNKTFANGKNLRHGVCGSVCCSRLTVQTVDDSDTPPSKGAQTGRVWQPRTAQLKEHDMCRAW